MLPLQFGVPGGPELLVLLMISVFVFGIPVLLVLVLLSRKNDDGASDDRVEELERRVEELEGELGSADDEER